MIRSLHKLLLLLLACLSLTACERGASPNDEVANELRALRLALRDSRPAASAEASSPAREAIDAALRPLRDVLSQLGTAQRELATRQTALTQELQRWTQLVVSALQEKSATQGRDLQQRLEQLEQSMVQQDARHREVEALLQGALDNTATHLEDFLRRLEQLTPRDGSVAPGDAGGGAPAPVRAPGGDVPEAAPATPGGTTDPPPGNLAREGSSRWLWWLVALVAVVMGVRLLLPRRDAALAVAPEMQSAVPDSGGVEAHRHAWGEAARFEPHADPPDVDEPEVEELWAAAALLGEAIGKIKQSAHPAEVERLLGGPLDGVLVADEEPTQNTTLSVTQGTPPVSRATPAVASATPTSDDPTEREAEQAGLDFDDVFVIDDDDVEFGAVAAPSEGEAAAASREVRAEPTVELPRVVTSARRDAPAPRPRPESITCRLPVRDAPRAAATVRELLGTDPRVLVQPPPEVRPAAGELCVQFSLLPGLPAGERSQLEQRLRDAVA